MSSARICAAAGPSASISRLGRTSESFDSDACRQRCSRPGRGSARGFAVEISESCIGGGVDGGGA